MTDYRSINLLFCAAWATLNKLSWGDYCVFIGHFSLVSFMDTEKFLEQFPQQVIVSGIKCPFSVSGRKTEKALSEATYWYNRGVRCTELPINPLAPSSFARIPWMFFYRKNTTPSDGPTSYCLFLSPEFDYGTSAPARLVCLGDQNNLNETWTAILNSRKPRFIHPKDEWLLVTKALAKRSIEKGQGIVSSVGTPGYDVVTYIATEAASHLILLLDRPLPCMMSKSHEETFREDYGWIEKNSKTVCVSAFPTNGTLSKRERMSFRDHVVTSFARRILVAAIRRKGYMAMLAREALKAGKRVSVWKPREARKDTQGNRDLLKKEAGMEILDAETLGISCKGAASKKALPKPKENRRRVFSSYPSGYVIHFTRKCPGPWPGQGRKDYLGSLVNGLPSSYHSALQTLQRILREKTIRASGKIYRGGIPMVSFTACKPGEVSRISRWNSALIRWTFEPYGIAFPLERLLHLGVKPVIYGDEEKYESLRGEERFFFQLHKPPKSDWVQEKEWRLPGDLSLAKFSEDEILVLVPHRDEGEEILRAFPYSVFVMEGEEPQNIE